MVSFFGTLLGKESFVVKLLWDVGEGEKGTTEDVASECERDNGGVREVSTDYEKDVTDKAITVHCELLARDFFFRLHLLTPMSSNS